MDGQGNDNPNAPPVTNAVRHGRRIVGPSLRVMPAEVLVVVRDERIPFDWSKPTSAVGALNRLADDQRHLVRQTLPR